MKTALLLLCLLSSVHLNVDGVQYCGSNQTHVAGHLQWWPASSIKVFIALAAWELLDRKKIRKDIYRALRYSSNISSDKLVDLLSRDRLTRWLRENGYKDTYISRSYSRRGAFRGRVLHATCKTNCTSMTDLQRVLKHALKDPYLKKILYRNKFLYSKAGYVKGYSYIENVYIKGKYITLALPAKKSYSFYRKKVYGILRKLYFQQVQRNKKRKK